MAPIPPRLVLTGSESTGKTTLARALAERFGVAWVPEFARDYATARAGQLTPADIEPIARGQQAAEDAAAMIHPGCVVLDTDLLSTWIYAHHYYQAVPGWLERELPQRIRGCYLLCDIDLPWVPDPARDRGDRREEMHAAFVQELERRSVKYAIVRGTGEARLQSALAAAERLDPTG